VDTLWSCEFVGSRVVYSSFIRSTLRAQVQVWELLNTGVSNNIGLFIGAFVTEVFNDEMEKKSVYRTNMSVELQISYYDYDIYFPTLKN